MYYIQTPDEVTPFMGDRVLICHTLNKMSYITLKSYTQKISVS